MKNMSPALAAHLGGELTMLAELVKITRGDNVVVAFTSHDCDLVIDGVTYKADGAFTAEKLIQSTELKARNYEVAGMLDSDLIDEGELKAGLFDHARIDVFLCNWADLSQGVVHIRRGWLGEIAMSGGRYVASLRGLHDLLTRKVGETYTPECRYCLGEARCGVSSASFTVTGHVTAVTDRSAFCDTTRSEATGWFDDGLLTWESGANAGASCEVSAWDGTAQQFKLWLPLPYAIEVGDAYRVVAGCDKRYATCRAKFGNGANYGGFPYLPGIGKLLQYPEG